MPPIILIGYIYNKNLKLSQGKFFNCTNFFKKVEKLKGKKLQII